MTSNLTDEQRAALTAGPLVLVDESSERRFVVVEESVHQQAMQALRRQEDAEAIQRGIDEMEAGQVTSFAEIDARLHKKLGLPPRQ